MLARASRRLSGILLVVFPTVIYGCANLRVHPEQQRRVSGQSRASGPVSRGPRLCRGAAGAFSGPLAALCDEAKLFEGWKPFARLSAPLGAILVPAGFFLSIVSPDATNPSPPIYLCFANPGGRTVRSRCRANTPLTILLAEKAPPVGV